MVVKNTGTTSTFEKHALSPEITWARIVNQISSAPFTTGDDSDSTFMDNSTCCQACYSSHHVMSEFLHLK